MPWNFAIVIVLCYHVATAGGNTRDGHTDLSPTGFAWITGESLSNPYPDQPIQLVGPKFLDTTFSLSTPTSLPTDTLLSIAKLFAPAGQQATPLLNPFEPQTINWIHYRGDAALTLDRSVPPSLPLLLNLGIAAAFIYAIEHSAKPSKSKRNRLW